MRIKTILMLRRCQISATKAQLSINPEQTPTFRSGIVEGLILFFVICCFVSLSAYRLDLPALHEDEAFRIVPALQILQDRVFLPDTYSFKIGNKIFPVMLTPFSGALNSYLLVPVIYSFGLTVKIIRLSQIFLAAIGIFLTYILCKKIINKKVALITVILLAINPFFILFNRQGLMISSLNLPLAVFAILLILQGHSKGRKVYLYSGFFLLGMPLFNNANFFWLLTAMTLSYWLIFRKDMNILFKENRMNKDNLITAFYLLLLGSAPFIWYNIQYFETIGKFIERFNIYYKNEGGLWYLKALLKNVKTFIFMLSGAYNAGSYGGYKGIINHVYPVLFLTSVVFTPLLLAIKKDTIALKKVLFFILVAILVLLQTPFSLRDANACDIYLLYPIPQIIIAFFLVELYLFLKKTQAKSLSICILIILLSLFEILVLKGYLHPLIVVAFLVAYLFMRKKTAVYFFTAFTCLFIFLELAAMPEYYKTVNKNGGTGWSSDAIYRLSDFLKDNKDLRPIAMDWGLRNRVLVLTKGEIDCKEFYSDKVRYNRYFNRMSEKLLERPGNLYLVNAPHLTVSETWPLFKEIADSKNIVLREIKRFNQRDGRPVFSVYKQVYEFDFIRNFSRAEIKIRGAGDAGIRNFSIKGDSKKVIFAHPLSEISYSLEIPENAILKFSIGIAENSWGKGDGTMGEVYIKNGNRETKVFSKFLNPHHKSEDRQWHDYEIDLSGFSGRNIDIIFKTFPCPIAQEEGDYEADWWGWGAPRIKEILK